MGLHVLLDQMAAVNLRIDLGGREAGMAQQFLNGTEIGAVGAILHDVSDRLGADKDHAAAGQVDPVDVAAGYQVVAADAADAGGVLTGVDGEQVRAALPDTPDHLAAWAAIQAKARVTASSVAAEPPRDARSSC